MALTRDELEGTEFDWFAVDALGHVALCSSAGYGEIPPEILEHCTGKAVWLHQIAELISALPETGVCTFEAHGPGSCEEWKQLARRGFFVYDWKHWSGPYQRIVVPEIATFDKDLPPDLMAALCPLRMADLSFSARESLSARFDWIME